MQIKGTYCKTFFRNTETGYTVFNLKLNEVLENYNKCYVKCMGTIKVSFIGIPVRLEGEFKEYNKELVFNFTDIAPFYDIQNNTECINSPIFKSLPKEIISDVIKELGPNPLEWDKIPNLFARLTEFDGIGAKRAQAILDNISLYQTQNELFEYINKFSQVSFYPDDVIAEYKNKALEAFRKHPYYLGYKMKLPFQCCDAIGRENGFEVNDTERLNSLIHSVLDKTYENGNTCFSLERMFNGIKYTSKHLSAFPDKEISLFKVFALINSSSVIRPYVNKEGNVFYYFNYSYDNEELLATNIFRLQEHKNEKDININTIIRNCERKLGIKYSDKQKECFNFLKSDGIKIITGGPGTGKSTVINGIINAFEELYPNKTVTMMAPTGRASQKIAEITHRSAGTIHRMLGINPIQEHKVISNFFADYPADLLVIDETSMLDNEIAGQVFKAVRGSATVLLVGDVDQLPSVGAGNVLKCLIDSSAIDVVHLDVNYRQGGLSTIAKNAEKIKQGYTDIITDNSFQVIKCKTYEEMQKLSSEKFCSLYNPDEPFETQMLNAVKKGSSGVIGFNKMLQKMTNSNRSNLQNRHYEFKKGDKVIITVNNYDQNCFNGDIGIIEDIIEGEMNIRIGNELVTYSGAELQDVHLAYAMSIHKSQGSEYNNVIICLPDESSSMLKRNLIYTAITRAKKNVYIYYLDNALNKSIMTNDTTQRLTNLNEMIERKIA